MSQNEKEIDTDSDAPGAAASAAASGFTIVFTVVSREVAAEAAAPGAALLQHHPCHFHFDFITFCFQCCFVSISETTVIFLGRWYY